MQGPLHEDDRAGLVVRLVGNARLAEVGQDARFGVLDWVGGDHVLPSRGQRTHQMAPLAGPDPTAPSRWCWRRTCKLQPHFPKTPFRDKFAGESLMRTSTVCSALVLAWLGSLGVARAEEAADNYAPTDAEPSLLRVRLLVLVFRRCGCDWRAGYGGAFLFYQARFEPSSLLKCIRSGRVGKRCIMPSAPREPCDNCS